MTTATQIAPPLLVLSGVGLAIGLFYPGVSRAACAGVIVLSGLIPVCLLPIAYGRMPSTPKFARWAIETWMGGTIAVAALATSVAAGIAFYGMIGPSGALDEQKKALTGTLTGAVSGALSALVMTALSEGSGPFSVEHHFKKAMKRVARTLPNLPPVIREVTGRDGVPALKIYGWAFKARGQRAQALAEYLNDPANQRWEKR